MPSIRIKFNFNTVTLNERGVVNGSKSLCGSTVEVIDRNGTTERFDFGGFRNYDNYRDSIIPTQFCKVWNVKAFYADDYARATFLDANEYCVGIYEANESAVYLLLDNNNLMTRQAHKIPYSTEKYAGENVIPIRKHPQISNYLC
ncbi:hypothetical protein ACPV5U_24470 [Vibrio mediterranei]